MKYTPGFVLLLGSWLQPLHLLPWVSWHSEVLAFAAMLWFFLIAILDQKNTKKAFFTLPRAAIAPLAMAFLGLIQYGSGLIQFFGDALVICFYMTVCSLAIVVGHAWGTSERLGARFPNSMPIFFLAVTVLSGAIVSILIALVQTFNVWDSADWIVRLQHIRRPGANMGQPNHFATLVLMGIASLAFLFESKKVSGRLATSTLIFMAWGLAISESRTGLLGAIGLTAWWFFGHRAGNFKGSAASVATGWVCLFFLVWVWPIFITGVHSGIGYEALQRAGIDTSAGMRLVVWPQLFEAVMQRPWFGWGLREVPEAHNAVAHVYAVSEPFSYSHNILLDLALGMGVPLTALLVLVTGIWLWRRVRTANQLLPWYCLALALPLAVHSMLEFPFAYAYFLVPVMFALGALEGLAGSKSALRIGLRPAAVLLFGVIIVAAWSVVEYVTIEEDFRVARFEALRVGQTPVDYQRPNVVLLTQLGALLEGARISPKPGMTVDALALARKVALHYPWTATQNRYALSLALNGDPEEAVRQLRVMKALHGEKTYQEIKANWNTLAQDKYPQLRELTLP